MLVAVLVSAAGIAATAESYRVTVTRKESNLYKIEGTRPTTYIKTRLCLELALQEDAILKYRSGAFDNKLIFDNQSGTPACDVVSLLTEDR